MKCLEFRKRLCTCVWNKKRLCILKKSSKICLFSWKYDIFKEKGAFFTIQGVSSAVIIFKAEKAPFFLHYNQSYENTAAWLNAPFSKNSHIFSSHSQKFNFGLKIEHFLKCYLTFKKGAFASNLLWDVRESFWSHQIYLG